jgi:hypothetical protein
MQWLEQLRLWYAARQYGRRLPAELRERYGASELYSAAQIGRTVEALGLDRRYLALGYAAFMSESAFSILQPSLALRLGYREARAMFERFAVSPSGFDDTAAETFYPTH